MDKTMNLRVGEDCWERVKLAAIKERVTMREWVERAVHQSLGTNERAARFLEQMRSTAPDMPTVAVPLTLSHPAGSVQQWAPPEPGEKHWTPDD